MRRSGGWLGGHGRGLGGEARGRTGRGRRAGRGAREPSLSRFSLFRDCVRSGRAPHGRGRTWEQFGKFHPNASLAHSAAFLLLRRRNQALSGGVERQLVREGADGDEFRCRLGHEAHGKLSMRTLGARAGLGGGRGGGEPLRFRAQGEQTDPQVPESVLTGTASTPRRRSPDGAPPPALSQDSRPEGIRPQHAPRLGAGTPPAA